MPEWMPFAWGELGVEEFAGPADNPRIVEYHKSCDDTITDDEVAWCSSFINWLMMAADKPRTKSRSARSWLKWGVEITQPVYGCVCVLWRESQTSWKGHVAIYLDETEKHVVLLGGNQGNSVSVRRYPKERVLGYRWL